MIFPAALSCGNPDECGKLRKKSAQTLAPKGRSGYNRRMKTIMRSALMPALVRELMPYGLLSGGSMLLAGVSGGADSVALLYAMAVLRSSHDFSLTAVHVEHGLRGEASKADAAYVRDLCQSLQVPLKMYAVNARAAMEEHSQGAEEAARMLRYGCFQRAMEEVKGAALLTAHHGGDQAETVLMHLLRGAGPGGLSGIAPRAPFAGGLLVRPLLCFTHADLCGALQEEGIPWREDETNARPQGLRNRLRLEILPALEALVPGCTQAMGRAASLLSSEEDWWQSEAEAFLKKNARLEKEYCFILRRPLESRHQAYIRRVLRTFYGAAMEKMGILMDRGMVSLSFEKTGELADCLMGADGGVVNLPGDIRGERSSQRLFLLPPKAQVPPKETPLCLSGSTPFSGAVFHARPWQSAMPLGDGIKGQALDKRALEGAVVRCRRAGDIFPLLNGRGVQKLKDTMSSHHVDRPLRDLLPVIAAGDTVLWAPGIGASNAAAIRPDTAEGIWLTYAGLLPWEIAQDEQDE